jgi:raffinose/stachyose/melibiose transport system permease protein
MNTNLLGFPHHLQFINWTNAWNKAQLGVALSNSIFVSLSVVVLVVLLSSMAGFSLARFKFKFATLIFLIFVLTMQAPVPIIALYVVAVKLKLTNTYWGLILPSVAGGLPLSIFIFRASFLSIPSEIMDAAKVDGCSNLAMFFKVIMPISGPAVATVAILQFMGAWNDYVLPLIMIRTPELRTLPLAIQVFFNQFGQVTWPEVFSALTIGTIPMLVLYVIMQKQFIQGLTSGAVKG